MQNYAANEYLKKPKISFAYVINILLLRKSYIIN